MTDYDVTISTTKSVKTIVTFLRRLLSGYGTTETDTRYLRPLGHVSDGKVIDGY